MLRDVGIRHADKGVHFFMYGVLGILLCRAMHNPPRTTRARVAAAALLLVIIFGGLDEWHQHYIKGRTTDAVDWLADSSGGLVGALIWASASRLKAMRTT
jgi:VanZ family protein